MSEKRFRAEVDDRGHLKIITNGETVLNDSYEVVDLLNELFEENEQLQQTVNSQQLTITNKQSIIKELFQQKGFCEEMAQNLKEDNEQLKSRIAFFEEQEDEFEEYTAQTIQNMIANYRDD